jgi:hypothetical protein
MGAPAPARKTQPSPQTHRTLATIVDHHRSIMIKACSDSAPEFFMAPHWITRPCAGSICEPQVWPQVLLASTLSSKKMRHSDGRLVLAPFSFYGILVSVSQGAEGEIHGTD